MKIFSTALLGAALLALSACATGPMPEPATPAAPVAVAPAAPAVPTGPSPTMISMGETVFGGTCTGCHRDGGRGPAKAVLATKSPNEVVAALSTGGKMARQGSSLSDEQKTAVAAFLTGKLPS